MLWPRGWKPTRMRSEIHQLENNLVKTGGGYPCLCGKMGVRPEELWVERMLFVGLIEGGEFGWVQIYIRIRSRWPFF